MKLTRYEKETIINFNEAEATANIYTHNGGLIRKLDALADQRPEEAKRGRSFPDGGREFTVPKRWVKVNAGPILTDEQRRAMAERAKNLRRSISAENH